MIRKYNSLLKYLIMLVDMLTIASAYLGVVFLKFYGSSNFERNNYIFVISIVIPLFIVLYYLNDAYAPMRDRLYRTELLSIIKAHFIASVLVLSALFLSKKLDFSREVALSFCGYSLLLIMAERYTVRKLVRFVRAQGFNLKHVLIIGAGPVGIDFAAKMLQHRHLGYNLIGFLDDSEQKHSQNVSGTPVLGGCRMLPELLLRNCIDEVFVALPLWAHRKYGYIINECELHGVRLRIIPDYSRYFPGVPNLQDFDGIPILNIREVPLDDPFNKSLKRIFDILVSAAVILLVSPCILIIALGVKLTSPGPIFFRQERIGLGNRPFKMLKFRTMRTALDDSPATQWTTSHDPRKTPFGSFLRKTSLDELPQFFNVFFGSMSVVGPRPERPFFVEQFREDIPRYMVKHQVKPGITGWAQVNGWRGDTSIEKRIECDLYYIENWDILFDIKIFFLTIFKGLVHKNAY